MRVRVTDLSGKSVVMVATDTEDCEFLREWAAERGYTLEVL